jgi:phosphoribosylformylglycinamidine cyclo-ligase
MGAGFAVFCGAGRGQDVLAVAGEAGMTGIVAGTVEAGRRRVVIEPLGISYEAGELRLS